MAGTDRRFDATKFRDAIHFAMNMGFADETEEQITWHWITERTFSKADSGGQPYTWSAGQVTSATNIADLTVKCAMKFTPGGTKTRVGGTAEGIFDPAQIEVTMLDTDWDLLITHGAGRFPEQAIVDKNLYAVQFIGPPVGLFDVTVYQIYMQAVDQSLGDI